MPAPFRCAMIIEVTPVRTAKAEQVVAPEHGQVVANRLVLAIPEALADVLRVYVVWDKSARIVGTISSAPPRPQLGRTALVVHCQNFRR